MAWKEIEGQALWRPENIGDSVEGKLLGAREVESDFDATKTYKVYDLETKKGTVAVIGGAKLEQLNFWLSFFPKRLMASIKIGEMIKIEYRGTVKVPNGKMRDFKVWTEQ